MIRFRIDFLFHWGWSGYHEHDRDSISFFLGPSRDYTVEFSGRVDGEGFSLKPVRKYKTRWFFRVTDHQDHHNVFVPGFMIILSIGK